MGSDKTFEYGVVIGRFQPVHNGHKSLLDAALAGARMVICIVGSTQEQRTLRNPFTFEERAQLIRSSYDNATNERLLILPLADGPDDHEWAMSVAKIVAHYSLPGSRTAVYGHHKDASSSYLDWFPQWEAVECQPHPRADGASVRDYLFDGAHEAWQQMVPDAVARILMQEFVVTSDYANLSLRQTFGGAVKEPNISAYIN